MAAVPDSLPLLSRGGHKHVSRGACFMEYTALLAGEPFSDRPGCVDPELAAVMRHANDRLSDADRARLLPLLGRSIGLGAGNGRTAVALRVAVAHRFAAAVGLDPGRAELRLFGSCGEVDLLFWHLMHEPVALSTSEAYVARLLDRLHLLHDCYERAMDDLGLPRSDAPAR